MNQSEREKAMTLQPHQQAYICRLRFARTGSLSYVGHLDLMRTFERSLRRAELPLLHSQGYNPRPMLVFALPLGVGISTADDYLDVSFSEEIDVKRVIEALTPKLPEGLAVLDGWTVPETSGSIMALVTAASYHLTAPGITEAFRKLFLLKEVRVEKKSKGQIRTLDIRPLMLRLVEDEPCSEDSCTILVCAGSHENVRPDLMLLALTRYCDYPQKDGADCEIERTGLFAGEYPALKRFKEINESC